MDYAFERDWQTLVKRMMDRFGEEPDVTSMVFAVGLQEAGQGAKRYKKDEKMDLMHVGVCTLLEPLGYYVREGVDEDGWPHFSAGEPLASADFRRTRSHDEAGACRLFRSVDRTRRRRKRMNQKEGELRGLTPW